MNTPKLKDYSLTFEAFGLTFALAEIGIMDFMPAGSMVIGINGKHSEFIQSKDAQHKMDKEGVTYFSSAEPIRAAARRLRELFPLLDRLLERFQVDLPPVSREEVEEVYAVMAEIQATYKHFGHGYTDTVYHQSGNDAAKKEALQFVADHKNDLRLLYDKAFFNADGGIPIFLQKLSKQFSVDVEVLTWYRDIEILNLFNGAHVDPPTIEARRKAFVMHKVADGRAYELYEGNEALTFINKFGSFESMADPRLIKGTVANKGSLVRGAVRIINTDYLDVVGVAKKMEDMQKGDILVSVVTAPDLMQACKKAAAIVTDVGGLLSHGAIIGRELGIPCIVDTQFASKVLKDGDMIEVDTGKGEVRKV